MTHPNRIDDAAAASGGALAHLEYSPGAAAKAGEILQFVGGRSPVAIITDDVAKSAGERDLIEVVTDSLAAARFGYVTVTPPEGTHGVVLDEATVADVATKVSQAAAVVTVGSGTVTDLGKAVTPPELPLVAVQSAPSVNGYADQLSVLVQAGAKSTRPTRWPNAILIDATAMELAPSYLVGSGVGDAVAVTCSAADWVLATHLEAGAEADVGALGTLFGAVARLAEGPDAPDAMEALVDALSYGGLAIGTLGSTAPLSGCEHLLSHILDMAAMASDGAHDLHGRQVGVATVLSAAIWHEAMDRDLLRVSSAIDYPDDILKRVDTTWRQVDPTGELSETCNINVDAKVRAWRDGANTRPPIDDDVVDRLRALVATPEKVVATLQAWGAPTRLSELTPSVNHRKGRWALAALPFMRNRITLADLLVMQGQWNEDFFDAVINRADRAGGGL